MDLCPKITWLVAVKNGMPFLPETLASIEAQTYRNWELLVWDNGSIDGTVEELQRWIPQRLPGRLIIDDPQPLAASRASLVKAAQTELCAWIDADDVNYPHRLDRQVGFLLAHPQIALVGSDVEFIDDKGNPLPIQHRQPSIDAELRWTLRWHNAFSQSTVLFRRSAVLAAGNYRSRAGAENCDLAEDYDVWLRVSFDNEVANLSEQLVKYRCHSRGVTNYLGMNYTVLDDGVAAANADRLFPEMSGAQALAFRSKLAFSRDSLISLGDFVRLARVAVTTAQRAGKPWSYFLLTSFCFRQYLHLLRRCVKQIFGPRAVRLVVEKWRIITGV